MVIDKGQTRRVFIQGPDGDRFEAEVPLETLLSELAADFFTINSLPRAGRAVVEKVDSDDPYVTNRLAPDATIEEAANDGDTLLIAPESTAGCFLGQVSIAMARGGRKPIQDIRVGDVIMSCWPASMRLTSTRVERVFRGMADNYLTVNGTLHITESHPVWSNAQWQEAGSLKINDSLQSIAGGSSLIKCIERHQESVEIWNLYVASAEHTFFADSMLVHNMYLKGDMTLLGSEKAYLQGDQLLEKRVYDLESKLSHVESQLGQIAQVFDGLGKILGRVIFRKVDPPKKVFAEIKLAGEAGGFDQERETELLTRIAERTGVSRSEIRVVSVTQGSVIVLLEMPEAAALKLLTLYLSDSVAIHDLAIERIELRPLLPRDLAHPDRQPPMELPERRLRIRILFLAANPSDTAQLRFGEEVRSIEQALLMAEFRDKFDIVQHWATRTIDLQSCLLRYKPDIVHFSGHGSSAGEIVLEDEHGRSAPVGVRALSGLFSILKDNIKCVVLNACYSERQARAIAKQIDCVVGMSKEIHDSAAISFATAFYQALGYGRDLKAAFDLGRSQIDLQQLNEHAVPKLLATRGDPSLVNFARSL
ncbi:MAG TPA: CHAT domain-containing protein [Terriglobia bacterium]|nr:CHAT domain-containing protein [Terriglobia bacterium]